LAFVASARGDVDAVEPQSDGEGVAADRPTKSRPEARKKKLQLDKKDNKLKRTLGLQKVRLTWYLIISLLRQRMRGES
jgi:hypothetical protein